MAVLLLVAAGTGDARQRATPSTGAALRTVLLPPPTAPTGSVASGAAGTFTGRLEQDGRWFHRLTYRIDVPASLGTVTGAHLRIGRSGITSERIVLTLCGLGSTAGCARGAREVTWLSNRHVQWLEALGGSIDVRTTRLTGVALRGRIAPRRVLTWTTVDVAQIERGGWTSARVEGADHRWPVGARIRLLAPRGAVGIHAHAVCSQVGSGTYTRPGGIDLVASWRVVSTGRPIVRLLPANDVGTRPCRWVVDALGEGGRMSLRLETLAAGPARWRAHAS